MALEVTADSEDLVSTCRFFFFLRGADPFGRQCEKSSSSERLRSPPPYCSGDQRETENIVTAFGANPLEEAEELNFFSRFCTVQV